MHVLLKTILLISLANLNFADLDPVNLCQTNNYYQYLHANQSGILQYDDLSLDYDSIYCELILSGYNTNTTLAITNLSNSTECDLAQTITINRINYCITEDSTLLEVVLFNDCGLVNITVQHPLPSFTLHYYIGKL